MATIAKNNIVQQLCPNSALPDVSYSVDSTISWNQGDILVLSYEVADAYKVLPARADDNAEVVLGVAINTVVAGKVRDPYPGTAVDGAQAASAIAGPVFGVVARLKLKEGDEFIQGKEVYTTTEDAQTVSVVNTDAQMVGVYVGPTVTAGADSTGLIHVSCGLFGSSNVQG